VTTICTVPRWKKFRNVIADVNNPRPEMAVEYVRPIGLHDAVLIVEPGHLYHGSTGLIVRADLNRNLYEIMLDKEQVVVYVVASMSGAGALAHMLSPALHRIETSPAAVIARRDRAIPIALATEEYSKRRSLAAFKIQRWVNEDIVFVSIILINVKELIESTWLICV
jgi:hypothetical protein